MMTTKVVRLPLHDLIQSATEIDGKELFYISPDSKMMTVPVSTRPVFQAGTPQALFDSDIVDTEFVPGL